MVRTRVIQLGRLERGIEGYQKIARHAVSAEAAAQTVAEVEETSGSDEEQPPS